MLFAARQVARARISLPLRATRPVPRLLAYRTLVTTKFTTDHESVAFDDATGVGTVGITHYAQKSLGDVVFVDLPTVGLKFSQGGEPHVHTRSGSILGAANKTGSKLAVLDPIGAVESVKAASDIFAPVSGEIVEINERLNGEPALVNRSPDDEGWLCKIKLSDKTEFDELLTLEAYAESHEP